jgi:hypothetical protein
MTRTLGLIRQPVPIEPFPRTNAIDSFPVNDRPRAEPSRPRTLLNLRTIGRCQKILSINSFLGKTWWFRKKVRSLNEQRPGRLLVPAFVVQVQVGS